MRLLPVLLLALSACFGIDDGPGRDCVDDADCDGECARTGRCVAAGSTVAVVVTWTIDGTAPTFDDPAACADIAELAVSFGGRAEEDRLTYRPVTCALGQVRYDRIPGDLTTVSLVAFAEDGTPIDRESRPLDDLDEGGNLGFELRGP